jgi:hypothetical protein
LVEIEACWTFFGRFLKVDINSFSLSFVACHGFVHDEIVLENVAFGKLGHRWFAGIRTLGSSNRRGSLK